MSIFYCSGRPSQDSESIYLPSPFLFHPFSGLFFRINQMLIVAGEYSLSTFEGTEQVFRPARMVVHPDYSATSKNADIMLIKVTELSVLGEGEQGTEDLKKGLELGSARICLWDVFTLASFFRVILFCCVPSAVTGSCLNDPETNPSTPRYQESHVGPLSCQARDSAAELFLATFCVDQEPDYSSGYHLHHSLFPRQRGSKEEAQGEGG